VTQLAHHFSPNDDALRSAREHTLERDAERHFDIVPSLGRARGAAVGLRAPRARVLVWVRRSRASVRTFARAIKETPEIEFAEPFFEPLGRGRRRRRVSGRPGGRGDAVSVVRLARLGIR
jgi:hypothetical protein